jgi:hypothetical protein
MNKVLKLNGTLKSNKIKKKLTNLGFDVFPIGNGTHMTLEEEKKLEKLDVNDFELTTCHIRWATRSDLKYNMEDAIWYKNIRKIPITIGLSDGTDYQNTFKLFFDLVDFFDEFYKSIELIETKTNLLEILKKKTFNFRLKSLSNILLRLFLPLDLDMQALIMLYEKEESISKALYEYFKAIQKDKDKPYINLIHSTIEILNEYQEIDLPDTFFTLIGIDKNSFEPNTGSNIYKFLKALDDTLNNFDSFNDTTKETIACEILNYFSKKVWKVEGAELKSFHDWYCALASCLLGDKVSKDCLEIASVS